MYAMIPVLWQNVKIFTVDSRNPSHDYKDFPRSLLPLRAAGVNPAPSGRPCLVFSALSLRSISASLGRGRLPVWFRFCRVREWLLRRTTVSRQKLLRTSAPPPVGPKRSVAPTSFFFHPPPLFCSVAGPPRTPPLPF